MSCDVTLCIPSIQSTHVRDQFHKKIALFQHARVLAYFRFRFVEHRSLPGARFQRGAVGVCSCYYCRQCCCCYPPATVVAAPRPVPADVDSLPQLFSRICWLGLRYRCC